MKKSWLILALMLFTFVGIAKAQESQVHFEIGFITETPEDLATTVIKTEAVTIYLNMKAKETLRSQYKLPFKVMADTLDIKTLYVVLEPDPSAEVNDDCLSPIANGNYDTYLKGLSQSISSLKSYRVFVSFAPEMNGDWTCWGQKPKAFIAAWRHVYPFFNGKMLLQYNIAFGGRMSSDLSLYNPQDVGEDMVSAIGIDGYRRKGDDCPSVSGVFGDTMQKITDIFPYSDVIITEFGTDNHCNHNAEWISELPEFLSTWPMIRGANWFQIKKVENGNTLDWRIHEGDEETAFLTAFSQDS